MMKMHMIIASTLVATALLGGCSREEPAPAPLTAPESTRQLDQNRNLDSTGDRMNETAPRTSPQNQSPDTYPRDQNLDNRDGTDNLPDDTETDMNGSESMYDNNSPTNNNTSPGTTTID